jgi:hypothetical protein
MAYEQEAKTGVVLSVDSCSARDPIQSLLIRFEGVGSGILQVFQRVLNPVLQHGIRSESASIENFQILQRVFDPTLHREHWPYQSTAARN